MRQRAFATSSECVTLPKDSNQALGIAEFAIDFMNGKGTPDEEVANRTPCVVVAFGSAKR